MFQFTPVLRRATGIFASGFLWRGGSIHARLATGDIFPSNQFASVQVSIHARLATGDFVPIIRRFREQFQFTPVLRRATGGKRCLQSRLKFQFTPVLRRATATRYISFIRELVSIHARLATGDVAEDCKPSAHRVSIHARLATGDASADLPKSYEGMFQFTPVLRRATALAIVRDDVCLVSIHARLATGDPKKKH